MKTQLATAAAFTLLTGATSLEAMAADGGFYVGANGGITLSSYSRSSADNDLVAAFNNALTIDSSAMDKPSGVWWADVGYMLSPHFGVEASYLNLGSLNYQAYGPYMDGERFGAKVNINSRGPALALRGTVPLWNAVSIDGRAGVYFGKSKSYYLTEIGSDGTSGTDSTTAGSLLLGVGGSYSFSSHLAMRLDYLYLNGIRDKVLDAKFNVSLLTAGLIYAF
jgi:opacity protein-like surface antigen